MKCNKGNVNTQLWSVYIQLLIYLHAYFIVLVTTVLVKVLVGM